MRNSLRAAAPALLLAGLVSLPASDASAHQPGYRDYYGAPDRYHVEYRRTVPPHWLRRHRDFMLWYDLQPYRVIASLSWHRLLRLYESDRYYHRYYKRHAAYDDKRYHKRGKKHGHDRDDRRSRRHHRRH